MRTQKVEAIQSVFRTEQDLIVIINKRITRLYTVMIRQIIIVQTKL